MRSGPAALALLAWSSLTSHAPAAAPDAAAGAIRAPSIALPVRVTRIDADVAIDPVHGTLHETVSMGLAAKGVARLVFGIDESLVVQSVRTSAGIVEFHQAGSELIVELDPPLDGERTVTFAIKGVPRPPSEIGPLRAVLAPAGAWYPLLSGTWAQATVVARVPAGWTAVAPGLPSARTAPDVWRWATTRPVRSIAVAAAPSLKLGEGSLVSVPFRLASAGRMSVDTTAARLAPAMAWLSGALAPYPFDAFTLVLLPGFTGRVRAGGMMIAGSDAPLTTDSDGADLLTGQWFGEALAGDGPWIEGFAAWEACVFARDRTLPAPSDVEAQRQRYFELRSGDVALARATPTTPAAVLRGKGSAAPDMVRLLAGNGATFDAVRSLFSAPIGPPLSLADVRSAFEARAGRSLERVFTDWFERAGAPQIEGGLRSFPAADGGFRADVTLTQTRGAYQLPVEIVIYGPGNEHRETVEIVDETTNVFYVLPFEPKRLEIDPLNRLFRRK
jgi:hypothetical protein